MPRSLLLTLTLLALGLTGIVRTAPAAPIRNVVLIVADDLGAHDLGFTGSRFHRTPNLDRLAAEGMRFTQAYSACTVCSPSRAALLTGMYPARLKLTDWIAGHDNPTAKLRPPVWTQYLPTNQTTLADRLGSRSTTMHLGKWHLGGAGFEPERRGFDINLGGGEKGQPPSYFAPFGVPHLKPDGPEREYLTDREGEEAAHFIAQHRERTFFLNYWPHAVHTPLQAPAELVEQYRARAGTVGGPQTNATYAAMLDRLDAAVGRILQAIADNGLTDSTLVIFTSDNGGLVLGKEPPTSNAPLRAGKGSAYEGGHRVPLVIRWPGVTRPGSSSDVPVMGIDLHPTVLAATGFPADYIATRGFDGVDLSPILRDPGARLDRSLYWHYPHYHPGGATPYAAIRSGDWKLIQNYENGRNELYNLAADPGESHDLGPEQPDRVMALARDLFAWQGKVGAQWPMPNPAWTPPVLAPSPDGTVLLHSRDAAVHGEVLRYEPMPFKNTLGWWSRAEDSAEWVFELPKAGRYQLDLQHGCGNGCGGSLVKFAVAGREFPFTVVETGGFQNWTNRIVATVDLPAGRHSLTVKPATKPGPAVMDIRQLTLRPAP